MLLGGGNRWTLTYWHISEFLLNDSVGREMLVHLSERLSESLGKTFDTDRVFLMCRLCFKSFCALTHKSSLSPCEMVDNGNPHEPGQHGP